MNGAQCRLGHGDGRGGKGVDGCKKGAPVQQGQEEAVGSKCGLGHGAGGG